MTEDKKEIVELYEAYSMDELEERMNLQGICLCSCCCEPPNNLH